MWYTSENDVKVEIRSTGDKNATRDGNILNCRLTIPNQRECVIYRDVDLLILKIFSVELKRFFFCLKGRNFKYIERFVGSRKYFERIAILYKHSTVCRFVSFFLSCYPYICWFQIQIGVGKMSVLLSRSFLIGFIV